VGTSIRGQGEERRPGAMDLGLSDEQVLLRDTAARFIRETCDLGKVRELSEGGRSAEPAYLRHSAEIGWLANFVPEEFGGGTVSGQPVLDSVIIAEERGRALQPTPFVPMNVAAYALAAGGTDDQRAQLLPGLASGETIVTWAVADAVGNWQPESGVTATPAQDSYVLSGTKGLVQDAHLADWLLVTAGSERGTLQFVVPADVPGMSVSALDGLDLTRRMCEVHFEGVELPPSALVGGAPDASELIDRQLQLALVLTVAESVGAMDEVFRMTVEYAKARIAFGRPIGSFQAIKHLLADTSFLLEASKAAASAAARSVQAEHGNARELSSVAKAFVGESGITLAQNCFQVFGGIGFTWEHDLHLFLRRLTADAVLYGQASWHRELLCASHGL
jgi:alkylation response protein AidB-like acyl-CoA dehydrogenase